MLRRLFLAVVPMTARSAVTEIRARKFAPCRGQGIVFNIAEKEKAMNVREKLRQFFKRRSTDSSEHDEV